jgi:hypothetical protein
MRLSHEYPDTRLTSSEPASFTRNDALNRLVVSGTQGADGVLAANLSVYPLWPGLPSTLFSLFGYDSRGNRVTAIDPKLKLFMSVFHGASQSIRNAKMDAQTY